MGGRALVIAGGFNVHRLCWERANDGRRLRGGPPGPELGQDAALMGPHDILDRRWKRPGPITRIAG
eukprot:6980681-Pyramimonas_sp.AAC.2